MINCIIVDDEPLALDLLEDNIRQIPFLKLISRCKNAFEAIEVMKKEKIDLLFLDIQMPGISGTQFLKSLSVKPMVIFITAYKKYALEGFELDVFDYLIKPVSFDRFLKSAHKALDYFSMNNLQHQQNNFIFVNADYTLIKVMIDDIAYIEGLKDYIKIYLINIPKPIITRLSIKAMQENLPYGEFVRTHKSYIVAIDKIVFIKKSWIRIGTVDIPVSEHYRKDLHSIIDKKSLLFKG
jgi:DNA-binding LytR/AlgR family response regulator